MHVVRCLKRRESPGSDVQSFYDAELCDHNGDADLELSVYVVESTDWPDIYLKHMASARNDPPRRALGIDLAFIGPPLKPQVTKDHFELLRRTHHVVPFADGTEVWQLATVVVDAHVRGDEVRLEADKPALRAVFTRDVASPEWCAFMSLLSASDQQRAAKWAKYELPKS